MSHALGVQANSTGECPGWAVSFATKEEAIAYVVSLAPRGTSIFDVPVVESGDPAASPEEIADLIAPAPIACAPWLTPIGASAAKDVLSRTAWTTGPRDALAARRCRSLKGAGPTGAPSRIRTALIGSCALEDGARCERKHWRGWPGQQWWRCSNESASVTFPD